MMRKIQVQAALQSPKTRKYGLGVLGVLLLFTVVGFFVLPPILKSVAVDRLSELLHRQVRVEKVRINPYELTLEIEGVRIDEADGNTAFASFDRLFANLQASSLFRGGVVLREIRLENPKIRIVRQADRRYNVSDLVDEFMGQPKSEGPTPVFSLNNIQLTGGVVEFDDALVGEKHLIDDITLALPFVSSMAYATESFVEPLFSARINGAPLSIKGKSKPFAKSLESEVAIDLNSVELAKYFDYLPAGLGYRLPIALSSGSIDTRLTLSFLQAEGKTPTLKLAGSATLHDLALKEVSGDDLLAVKQLQLDLASADLLRQHFAVARLAIDTPVVHTRVHRDGQINWLALLPEAKPAPAGASSPAPVWSLADLTIKDGAVYWSDESSAQPFAASLESINIGLQDLDNQGKTQARFALGAKLLAGKALTIDSLKIEGGTLDLGAQEVAIDALQVAGVSGYFQRRSDGAIDWIAPPKLVLPASPATATPPKAAQAWRVAVARFAGDGIALTFDDKTLSPAVTQTVEGMHLVAENLSTDAAQPVKLSTQFKLNRKGELAVEGTLQPVPLTTDLKLTAKTLELMPLQPYFSRFLNIAVTRGHVSLAGDLKLRQNEMVGGTEGGAEADGGFSGAYAGEATIGDFSAVDKLNSADFLRWKSFYFGKIDAQFNPNKVSIGDVALADFFARVIVNPEGKLNLLQIVRSEDGTPESLVPETAPATVAAASADGKAATPVVKKEAAAPVMPLKLGKITLQGGSVRFTDNFVKPNYTANLKSIGGSLTGLSSEPGTLANLELRGSYDGVAPLNLTAKLNPLLSQPYLDLQADVKGVELTPFSSYSGKYAGYAIEKGKLSLFVKYKIENRQLQAENRVFLDQLSFGDAVDSPSATKLPVRLAVSLLKNRNGEIDLELPISGSLDDPQFSVGGLVVKVVVNLLVKAVTSPFALLGSMLDGGEELSNVEFAYGLASISPETQKRLDALAKALVERPQLKLEIEAQLDPEADREGLKKARLAEIVRGLKRAELTKEGVESGSDASVTVSDEEYPDLLERAYRAEKFPKPRNAIGLVKSLPVEEMEKLMLANSNIEDEDLRGLGDQRARTVRDWLVEHAVPAERIFLLPSKLGAGESEGKAGTDSKRSRVNFSLK